MIIRCSTPENIKMMPINHSEKDACGGTMGRDNFGSVFRGFSLSKHQYLHLQEWSELKHSMLFQPRHSHQLTAKNTTGSGRRESCPYCETSPPQTPLSYSLHRLGNIMLQRIASSARRHLAPCRTPIKSKTGSTVAVSISRTSNASAASVSGTFTPSLLSFFPIVHLLSN